MDLELIATQLWEISLTTSGRTADLAKAKERTSGAVFPGFERKDGVWALGLMCSACQNPAPVLLSVLEPSDGGG
jgi:hypothetical protein